MENCVISTKYNAVYSASDFTVAIFKLQSVLPSIKSETFTVSNAALK